MCARPRVRRETVLVAMGSGSCQLSITQQRCLLGTSHRQTPTMLCLFGTQSVVGGGGADWS